MTAPAGAAAGGAAPVAPRRRRRATAVVAATIGLIAGAAALVLPAGGATGGGPAPEPERSPRTVHITAHHSRFTPVSVDVRPGMAVRFVIRNLDPIDHEFIVGDAEVQKRHETGREAHHHGEVPGEITVPAGATVSTTWTAPASPGPVAFACHLPGHFAYGMAGVVQVTRS